MIKFNCPKCQTKISVKNEYADKQGRCPDCKCVVQVPAADVFDDSIFDDFEAASQEQRFVSPRTVTSTHGTIRYRCNHCRAILESDASFAGKWDTCPTCGKLSAVPGQSTVGFISFLRLIPKPIAIGIVGVILLSIISLVLWQSFRDTWEEDHYSEIQVICQRTQSHLLFDRDRKAVEQYQNLLELIGDRTLEDPELIKVVAETKRLAEPAHKAFQDRELLIADLQQLLSDGNEQIGRAHV